MKKYYITGIFIGLTLAISPIHAQATLTPEQRVSIQEVIQSLLLQVAELIKQLQAQIAQQTVLTTQMEQIVQNQTPSKSSSIGSPAVSNPVPIDIEIAENSVSGYGGNCSNIVFDNIKVKYNDGTYHQPDTLQFIYSDGSQQMETDSYKSEFSNHHTFSLASGTEKVLVVKGNLTKEISVVLRPLIISRDGNDLTFQNNRYIINSSGQYYNPDTYQCD